MKCQKCESERILSVTSKCSDCCFATFNGIDHDGYVPFGLGIGGGDYIEFDICLTCGQLQGTFPIEKEATDVLFRSPELEPEPENRAAEDWVFKAPVRTFDGVFEPKIGN